jgi:Secretion system C-terminal sorting domain
MILRTKFLFGFPFIGFFTFCIILYQPVFSFGQGIQFELVTGTNKYDDAKCIIQTFDSGYAVVGSTSAFGGGQSDIYLTKISKQGLVTWQQAIGGSGIEKGNALVQTPDSGFVIAGYTNSELTAGYDVYLAKTDKNGALEWSNTFGGFDWDFGNSIIQTATGDFVICGSTFSYGKGNEDVYLIKTNSTGKLLWDSAYGGSRQDVGNSISESADGGYFITGFTKSFGKGNEDVYLLKTDRNGNLKWTKAYGGALEEKGNEGKATADGGYVVISTEKSFSPANHYENWLLKTDSLGDTLWTRRDANKHNRISTSVCQTSDGGYVFAGHYDGQGQYNMFLCKTSPGGWYQLFYECGGSGNEYSSSVKQTFDKGYVLLGTTGSYGIGLPNIYIVKTDDSLKATGKIIDVVSVKENDRVPEIISLYPNPASDHFMVKAGLRYSLEIFDQVGRRISASLIERGENTVSVSSMPDGIYLVRIHNETSTLTGKIIIRH